MLDRPSTRLRVLSKIIAHRMYIEDLQWETRFMGGATVTPEITEERDRGRAEADFRLGLSPPIMVLALVLAYRASLWFLVGAIAAIWLLYLGSAAYAEADGAILRAVAEGRVTWPAAERLARGRVHLRSFPSVTRRWPLPGPRPDEAADHPHPAEAERMPATSTIVGRRAGGGTRPPLA
jgi:hypothetical protein